MNDTAPSISEDLPKQFLLDTNVLMSDPQALYKFQEHDVILTMTLLEELDRIKDGLSTKNESAKKDARTAIHNIKNIINGATNDELKSGVSIGKNLGVLRLIDNLSLDTKTQLDLSVADNRFIEVVIYLQENEKDKETHFVTKDFNLELKSRTVGVKYAEDYLNDYQIDDIAHLKSGFITTPVNLMEMINSDFTVDFNKEIGGNVYTFPVSVFEDVFDGEVSINTYVFEAHQLNSEPNFVYKIVSIEDGDCQVLAIPIKAIMNQDVYGIKPKSIYQGLAIFALLDKDIDFVQLSGPAGSGKTLLALASAIAQTKANVGSGIPVAFNKIIVTRSLADMDEPIGFLPGTEEEKMAPWLSAFNDSFDVLIKPMDLLGNTNDKLGSDESEQQTLRYLIQSANIQMKSLNFMRGRSLTNTCLILDEAQNTTPHQMKSIVTRMGVGSKIIVLGNLAQIDSPYILPTTSGLTHAVEKMKDDIGSTTMNLPGGERSRLSAAAEEKL